MIRKYRIEVASSLPSQKVMASFRVLTVRHPRVLPLQRLDEPEQVRRLLHAHELDAEALHLRREVRRRRVPLAEQHLQKHAG